MYRPNFDPIPWFGILRALNNISGGNFRYTDVPWIVSKEATLATLPEGAEPVTTQFGDLVGSGEQGFIQRMMDNNIEDGWWYTITPCFRAEPVFDELHRLYFMKIEMIVIGKDVGLREVESMIAINMDCVSASRGTRPAFVQKTMSKDPLQIDTFMRKPKDHDTLIEVGSFGIRKQGPYKWAYGTALAEPRSSLFQR